MRRNPETREWDAFVIHPDGTEIYLGRRVGSWDAEQLCDEYVDAQLQQQPLVVAETGELESRVIAERVQIDDDEPLTWTDYRSGCVLLGVEDNTSASFDLIIHGCEICGVPITLAILAGIYTDLGSLLADARVRAALPGGDAPVPPPYATGRVRTRKLATDAAFPLVLSVSISAAFSRNQDRLGITRDKVYELMMMSTQVIDDLFDLRAGPLRPDSADLIDLAYARGWKEALEQANKNGTAPHKPASEP